jgi:hypothetical protein
MVVPMVEAAAVMAAPAAMVAPAVETAAPAVETAAPVVMADPAVATLVPATAAMEAPVVAGSAAPSVVSAALLVAPSVEIERRYALRLGEADHTFRSICPIRDSERSRRSVVWNQAGRLEAY